MITLESNVQSIEEVNHLHKDKLEILKIYQRATNYLAVAQIYLQDNVLLREPLKPEHIKPRLLGHWGTCPGINLIYAHLNRLIIDQDIDMLLITGPGHGAPANLANLYLEGSLLEFYKEMTLNYDGLKNLIHKFSWPGGFPSHLYPGLPGTIHEGGELGYALSTAYGAVMDNPELIVACIIGDGEAETGATAAAWHSHRFIDPAESGAVLPIVHINGYKISSPTIFGTMTDEELILLFSGYGYAPYIVKGPDLNAALYSAMDWAYLEIKKIQEAARNGSRISMPKWPVILLQSLKGWTGIKEFNGQVIEGSYRSHQVPITDPQTNPSSLKLLQDWLLSYRPEELFDHDGHPVGSVLRMCPTDHRRMGMNPHTIGRIDHPRLHAQDIYNYEVDLKNERGLIERGKVEVSNMRALAKYLSSVIQHNPKNFRIFSPDELESNRLNVFDVTHRNFQWPVGPHDTNISAEGGQVLEILSEHTCQGWMQGYVLTGRYALFPSYEAFLGIIATMMDQFAKFMKMSKEIPWRKSTPSLNYIATSTLWRQEHNGFSHQNPGFMNTLLNKKGEYVRIYLPPDANCLISTIDHCFRTENYLNLVISSKQEMPQWLSMEEAVWHCRAGASIWKWASTDDGINPDVVLVGIGAEVTLEVMAAAHILRQQVPSLRIRIVNVTDLLVLEKDSKHPHGMDCDIFESLFTTDRPVIFNFHGYPSALQQLLFNRSTHSRFHINGYQEEGTTTTPFDMMIRNGTSRFHLIKQAIKYASQHNPYVANRASELSSFFDYRLRDHSRYIEEHGKDPEDIAHWKWT